MQHSVPPVASLYLSPGVWRAAPLSTQFVVICSVLSSFSLHTLVVQLLLLILLAANSLLQPPVCLLSVSCCMLAACTHLMPAHTHTYVHMHTHMPTHTHPGTHMHVCMLVHEHTHAHTQTHIKTQLRMPKHENLNVLIDTMILKNGNQWASQQCWVWLEFSVVVTNCTIPLLSYIGANWYMYCCFLSCRSMGSFRPTHFCVVLVWAPGEGYNNC